MPRASRRSTGSTDTAVIRGIGRTRRPGTSAAPILFLIVPAVISLMGKRDWWLPRRPARLLRVEPSRLRTEGSAR
jgi:uncharacterized membrane protein YdfJ with MMPL/SSD domain